MCNVGCECLDVKVKYFPGIRMEKLHRVTENRDLWSPDTGVIHVGINDVGRIGNLNYVMGDVCNFVNTAKTKF
jgi:hypothetical protein